MLIIGFKYECLVMNRKLKFLLHFTPRYAETAIKSKTIRNKIYESIRELETYLTDFFKKLDANTIRNVCAYGY